MPNTFVHLGIQTLSSRALLKGSDFRWIALGCIIPDLPWILQRLILSAGRSVDPYALHQYVTVQAALFSCLIISGALALLAADSGRIFFLLAANSLLHLLLDAMEIKWANGVHLFAPFSWQLTGFNLFWPEHAVISILTGTGFLVLVYFGFRDRRKQLVLTKNPGKYTAAFLLLMVYFTLPLGLSAEPLKADNHYRATLINRDERPGKHLELDRSRYRSSDRTVLIFSGERISVTGDMPARDGIVSVRGYFIDPATIHISSFHVHSRMREISSISALAGVLLVWFFALAEKRVVFERGVAAGGRKKYIRQYIPGLGGNQKK